jgi:hypothetical protein
VTPVEVFNFAEGLRRRRFSRLAASVQVQSLTASVIEHTDGTPRATAPTGQSAVSGPKLAKGLGVTNSKQLIRAVTLLASLGFSACGPLCLGGGETREEEYETSQSCSGTVEASAALGLSTTPSASCYAGLLRTCGGLGASCVQDPSTCPSVCLPIEVVKPNNQTAGVAVVINVNTPFMGERMFAANDPGLTIQALSVDVPQTVATGGDPLTVTGGSVKLRMVPNDVTAIIARARGGASGSDVSAQGKLEAEVGLVDVLAPGGSAPDVAGRSEFAVQPDVHGRRDTDK